MAQELKLLVGFLTDIQKQYPTAQLGEEGVRDPEYPCDSFTRKESPRDCGSDGHYLCRECGCFDKEAFEGVL